MSRATMAAAAADLPRAGLYGIASCKVGADFCDFEIGWGEAERDMAWAEAVLRTTDLGGNDIALVTLPNWEGLWFSPLLAALRTCGLVGVGPVPHRHRGADARGHGGYQGLTTTSARNGLRPLPLPRGHPRQASDALPGHRTRRDPPVADDHGLGPGHRIPAPGQKERTRRTRTVTGAISTPSVLSWRRSDRTNTVVVLSERRRVLRRPVGPPCGWASRPVLSMDAAFY